MHRHEADGSPGPVAPAFEAATVHGDGQVVVSVSGELDIATADQLWQAIETATQRSRRLVIDLSRTTFIDSTGLSVLVRAHRRLGGAPEALTLRGPSALARKVLDISGISQMVTIEPSAT